MLLKYAFRNIFRSRKRSLLTILSIFFAAMIVGFAQGWVNGLMDTFWDTYIQYQSGHVRIAPHEFVKKERFLPVEEYIPDSGDLAEKIKMIGHVKGVEQRIRFGLLLANGDTTQPAVGVGLDIADNSYNLKSKIIEGKFVNDGVYIGRGLASRLKLKCGDEILIAAKTSEGGLNGIKAEVRGILFMGVSVYDKKYFFMPIESARRLLKMKGGCTELYIFTDRSENTLQVKDDAAKIKGNDYATQTYIEQAGGAWDLFNRGRYLYYIIEAVIMFLASFVIVNTLMMAVFERIREIGTLKALGMTDREVFRLFTIEGAIMGAIGGAAGALAGYLIIVYLSVRGINLESAMSSIEMPFPYVIKPKVAFIYPLIALMISIGIPVLSSMIPARYIKKITPGEALKK